MLKSSVVCKMTRGRCPDKLLLLLRLKTKLIVKANQEEEYGSFNGTYY